MKKNTTYTTPSKSIPHTPRTPTPLATRHTTTQNKHQQTSQFASISMAFSQLKNNNTIQQNKNSAYQQTASQTPYLNAQIQATQIKSPTLNQSTPTTDNQNLADLKNQCTIQSDKQSELEKRLKKLETTAPTIDTTTIENNITSLQTDVSSLQSTTQENTTNITNLQGDIAQNTTNIANLQSTTTTNATNITNLTTRVTALENAPTPTIDTTTIENNIATNTGNITALSTRVAVLENAPAPTVDTTSLQNAITTNANNISTLTTSVNSCVQAINDINNSAELPTPLFTINGHSFGTPFLNYEDSIEFEFKRSMNVLKNLQPFYFICEPYSPLTININLKIFYVYASSSPKKLTFYINDTIFREITILSNLAKQTEDYVVTLKFTPNTNKIKLTYYLADATYHSQHQSIKIHVTGKNVCVLNSKQNFKFNTTIDNHYVFTKTYDCYPLIMEGTFNQIDFENGWLDCSGNENINGNQHEFIYKTIINENGELIKGDKHLSYSEITSAANKIYNTVSNTQVFFCGDNINLATAQLYTSYSKFNIVRTAHNSNGLPRTFFIDWENSVNKSIDQIAKKLIPKPNYFADVAIVQEVIFPLFSIMRPTIFILVNEVGKILLYENDTNYLFLDFGTQPSGYFLSDSSNDFCVFINQFGTIKRYIIKWTENLKFSVFSTDVFTTCEKIIKGFNDEYFLIYNDFITKKQM